MNKYILVFTDLSNFTDFDFSINEETSEDAQQRAYKLEKAYNWKFKYIKDEQLSLFNF